MIVNTAKKIFLKINLEKKNNLIAENYIKAGIYLNSGEKQKSKIIYEEIINSKNKFYSILALNTILEKDLISEKQKLLSFFDLIERINFKHLFAVLSIVVILVL